MGFVTMLCSFELFENIEDPIPGFIIKEVKNVLWKKSLLIS